MVLPHLTIQTPCQVPLHTCHHLDNNKACDEDIRYVRDSMQVQRMKE